MTLYRIADTPFNRHWHGAIIGRVYTYPVPYAAIEWLAF